MVIRKVKRNYEKVRILPEEFTGGHKSNYCKEPRGSNKLLRWDQATTGEGISGDLSGDRSEGNEKVKILHSLGIHNFTIVGDEIHVNQNVELIQFSEKKLPVKIHRINGYLKVRGNCLESLENCPDIVTDYADFSYNNLKNLKGLGAGINILIVDSNILKDLSGAENSRLLSISFKHNPIRTLENAPFSKTIIETSLQDGKLTHQDEVEIYHMACVSGTWDPYLDMKSNLKKLLMRVPSLMEARKWKWIEDFRYDLRGSTTRDKFNM